MTPAGDSATPTAMIDRVALLLDAFDGPGRLTLAQIVRRTGLPRSSAHRMLERLVQLRFLRRYGRDYELGMRLVELGHLAVHQDRVHKAALPHLWELHRTTGLVVHLAVLDGTDVVYLDKVGDRWGAALPSRIGGRHPAHCTAVGKVMLASCDAAQLAESDLLTRKTRHSIATAAHLRAELTKVRSHGFAFDREESVPGFGCLAAPIGTVDEAIAAVSVCGPLQCLTFDRLAAPVRGTAVGIWRSVDNGPGYVHPILQRPRSAQPKRIPTPQYA